MQATAMKAKVEATALQAKAQVKEQGKANTEHLLLSGASRNSTSSNPESSETSAPEPSHAGPAGASGMTVASLRRRRSSPKMCTQPGFAVVGLVGAFGERVLLLPIEKRRRRLAVETAASAASTAAAAAAAAAAAPVSANDDSEGGAACDGEGKRRGVGHTLLYSVSYLVRWHGIALSKLLTVFAMNYLFVVICYQSL